MGCPRPVVGGVLLKQTEPLRSGGALACLGSGGVMPTPSARRRTSRRAVRWGRSTRSDARPLWGTASNTANDAALGTADEVGA